MKQERQQNLRVYVLAAVAATLSLLVAQAIILNRVETTMRRLSDAETKTEVLRTSLRQQQNELSYKRSLTDLFRQEQAKSFDTANEFYSLLQKILAKHGMEKVAVSEASGDNVSLSISGEDDYFNLLSFLAEITDGTYMIRCTSCNIDGKHNGMVGYKLTLECMLSRVEQ